MSWINLIGIYILLELIWNAHAGKSYNRKLLGDHYRVKNGAAVAPETYIDEEAPVASVQYGNKSGNSLPNIQVHHSRRNRYQTRVVNTIFFIEPEAPEITMFKATTACFAIIVFISFVVWMLLGKPE